MMSPVDRFRFWLARGLVKAAALPVLAPWVSAPNFFEPTFLALTREGYKKNSAVFACLSALAFSFPEPPVQVASERDGALLPAHPLRVLLRRPNNLMGEPELMGYTILYMGLGGNAYWHKVRSSAGRVVELWPYHAGQMRPIPAAEKWISGYEYSPTGDWTKAIEVPLADVVHFKWPAPDPEKPWQALPPLIGAARDVDSANEITRYLFALLKNDAVPRVALELPPGVIIDDAAERRLKAQWKEKYGGDNRGDVAIVEGGATIRRVGLDMRELALDALYTVPERHIAAAFRVPLFVAGLGEDPIYANSSEARLAFTETTLAALWTLTAGEIQNSLGDTEYGGGVTVSHDLSRVTALAAQMAARKDWALKAFQAGGILLNEFRRESSLPTLRGGDVRLRGLTVDEVPGELGDGTPPPAAAVVAAVVGDGTTVPAADTAAIQAVALNGAQIQAALDIVLQVDDGTLPRASGINALEILFGLTRDQAERLLAGAGKAAGLSADKSAATRRKTALRVAKAQQRVRRELAGKMEVDVNRTFDELAVRMVQRLQAGKGAKAAAGDLFTDADAAEVERVVKRWYVAIVEETWETWNLALDAELAFDLTDPAVTAALKQAGTQIRQINATTRDAVRELLQLASDNGWSVDQIARGVDGAPGLRDLVAETYKHRARTIARTELGTAQQVAAAARYQAAGVEQVLVLDNGFDDSDPVCQALGQGGQGTLKSIAWAQANPLQHPNCVRAFAPWIE